MGNGKIELDYIHLANNNYYKMGCINSVQIMNANNDIQKIIILNEKIINLTLTGKLPQLRALITKTGVKKIDFTIISGA